MMYWIRYGLIVFAWGILLAGVARTDEINSAVTDGPSRGELFQLRLRAEFGLEAALSAAAAPSFILPTDVKGDAIFGIDVSHHNDENCKCKPGQICTECKIDWSRIQTQRVSFVYVKASQGRSYADPTFEYHWRVLAQHKIARGAYHFMSADEDPVVQADNFVDKLEDAGKLQPADLPPCLDLEADVRKDSAKRWIVDQETGKIRDFWSGQEPGKILEKVTKWLRRVEERTGRVPIIYTSHGWWKDLIKDETKIAQLQRYPIWVANYPSSGTPLNSKPKVPNGNTWALWQFTETGRLNDSDIFSGKVDINIFNGSLGRFEQALGAAVPEPKEVASLEKPKEENKPSEPVAVVNPNMANDTSKPPEQTAAVNPNTPAETSKPPEQAASVNPNTPTETNKPSDQVPRVNPSTPSDASKPSEQTASVNPNTPTESNKPAEQIAGANPSEPNDANKPSEQVAAINPSTPSDTSKPPEPAAVVNPATPTDNNKPNEQAAALNPNTPKEDGTAANQQAGTNPNVSQQSATPSGSRPSRSRTPRSSSPKIAEAKTPTETVAAEKAAERMLVEIVLINGRVLRVDANIAPEVLARLIAALDGN